MNAAARAINESNFFTGQLMEMRLSKPWCFVLSLLLAVLVSALAVIYTTNEQRLSFNQLEQLQQQTHALNLQWGQLLLEQASLSTPARVEQLAMDKLQMQLPSDNQTYVLKSQ